MIERTTKITVISSMMWKLMERFATQGIQFVVQIVLARLLLPSEYGLIALVSIFIVIANVFVQSGFNTALVQKKDADELDFSSVLFFSLFVSGILYVLLFVSAPVIGEFFHQKTFVPVVRVLSLTLFVGAFTSVQTAVVARNMKFKRLFYSSVGGIALSGIAGIFLAYAGFGVWSLVTQQLINTLSVSVILWFTLRWRPMFAFSISRVKVLFSFGGNLLASALLDTLYSNGYGLVIGRIGSSQQLGYYNQASRLPNMLVSNIDGAIQSVMLPTLSSYQDQVVTVKRLMRRGVVTSSFVVFPLMTGLGVCAEPIVRVLLTDKWLPAVPFIQLMSLYYAFWPIHTANLQAINALGRSDIFVKLEILKKSVGIAVLLLSIHFGVYVVVAAQAIISVSSTFINAWPNRKLLKYSYREQISDILPSVLLSLVMAVSVSCVFLLGLNPLSTLALQVSVGVVVYLGLALLFRLEAFNYLVRLLLSLRH